jgi:membrane protein required for colicin V production
MNETISAVGFNWVDAVILAILGLSALISLFRGFVRETLSLISWVLAFWVALTFGHTLGELFLQKYINSPTVRLGVAFGGLFLVTLIACAIFNYFISQLVDKTGLSGTDRMLGLVFGIARGVVLVAALLLVAHLTPMPEESFWKQSLLIPHFEPLELWLKGFLPDNVSDRFKLSAL